MRLRKYYLFLFFICSLTSSHSQVNLRISYDLSRFESQTNEEMTNAFNTKNDFLVKGQELPELNYLNGLSIGISYMSKFTRVELGYSTATRSREAFGEKPAGGQDPATNFETSMRYRLAGIYLSSELILARFSIGAALTSDAIRLKSDIAGSSNDKIITNQRLYAFSPFLSYQLYQGDNLSLVLKPYFKIALQAMNHGEIYQFLDLDEAIGLVDRPYSLGISVVFYNGKQVGR